MTFVLQDKCRGLKIKLKEWNKEEFGNVEERLKNIVESIKELDIRGESMGLDSLEVTRRKELFLDFWKFQKCKEVEIFQRSRSKWLRLGDTNSKYFHGCVLARSKRNNISALKVGDIWLESPSLVRDAVVNFFQNHFAATSSIRPNLDGVDGNKSPGPDGFNFAFLKSNWELLKHEIRILFDQFHGIGKLPKSLLSYFVALIPKVNSPFGLGDFRPISLLGCWYKLIAKVLATRLACVMKSLIAPNQSAFIKGRNLVDGVLVVNEVVDLAKRTGKECLIFKVDFEKAYDSVDWGFLEYMLRRFGFCEVWIGWIQACIFGGNLSVLVNGSPTGEINIQRGLKQGDLLAPFLFLLVAEGFGGAMRRAGELHLFKGFSIRSGGPCLPFKYLGLPVGANPRRLATWDPLVEKIRRKLNSWGNKHISLGGRIVLINSVLNSIPIFYMSFMKMPAQVIKKVTRIQRDFLWGGVNGVKKLSWVKWKVVCQQKKKGGLGIRDLKMTNLSLLLKWRWRLLQRNVTALWKEVLVAKYGDYILHDVNLSNGSSPSFASLWWKDIRDLEVCVENRNWLLEVMDRRIGNGVFTRFWVDKWVGDTPLCVSFPRLFSLSLQKLACVSEVVINGESGNRRWNLLWRRNLFAWEEESVIQLVGELENVTLSREEDCWWWKLDLEGGFSVKTAYDALLRELVPGPILTPWELKIFESIWESPAPSKVISFSWQLLLDRVPTKENLLLRGIIQQPLEGNCVWCDTLSESASHLFLHCRVAHVVWYEIFKWLGVVIVMPSNVLLLFDCMSEAASSKKSKNGFRLVWHSVLWILWRARNNKVFNNIAVEPVDIIDEVKVISWKWSVERLKIAPCLFYEWLWEPDICFNSGCLLLFLRWVL
ncbi:unnamed protein product [Trifolium pratense]|uniref:Uncharacterized protein n=1 Tax=Trifolium pratense TaxID=57577 RepID=A0ACB0L8X9_TRIPR|nr:unnamed protein product [Trifolium pratense]